MKYLLPILLSLSVLCTSLAAVEYGVLSTQTSTFPYKITLNENDIFEIIGVFQGRTSSDFIAYTLGTDVDEHWGEIESNRIFTVPATALLNNTICGPMEIKLQNSGTNDAYTITYKLTRASEEVLTSNTVTLPAVNGLDWAVTLEQSTDLANWTAVAPGTVTGTDSLQFYRVRVTSNASSGE